VLSGVFTISYETVEETCYDSPNEPELTTSSQTEPELTTSSQTESEITTSSLRPDPELSPIPPEVPTFQDFGKRVQLELLLLLVFLLLIN